MRKYYMGIMLLIVSFIFLPLWLSAETITEVTVNLPAPPTVGASVNYNYSVPDGANYTIVTWNNGELFIRGDIDDNKYLEGEEYNWNAVVCPVEGYEFPEQLNDLSFTVNGFDIDDTNIVRNYGITQNATTCRGIQIYFQQLPGTAAKFLSVPDSSNDGIIGEDAEFSFTFSKDTQIKLQKKVDGVWTDLNTFNVTASNPVGFTITAESEANFISYRLNYSDRKFSVFTISWVNPEKMLYDVEVTLPEAPFPGNPVIRTYSIPEYVNYSLVTWNNGELFINGDIYEGKYQSNVTYSWSAVVCPINGYSFPNGTSNVNFTVNGIDLTDNSIISSYYKSVNGETCRGITINFKKLPNVYTVSFNTNGAGDLDNQRIIEGNFVEEPTSLSKEGYEFAGWYTDSSLTSRFFLDTPVTSDLTLYAKWNVLIDTVSINSTRKHVYGGTLPEFIATTTTAHASIEDYGSNTGWSYMEPGYSSWHGFGLDTPTAVVDGETTYALRLAVNLEKGYAFTNNLKIIFNGKEYTQGNTEFDKFSWGGYVYIDLGIAVEEPILKITFDFNGGKRNGKATEVFNWTPRDYVLDKNQLLNGMTIPLGKELDAILVNGERYELGSTCSFDENTTLKYVWKKSSVPMVTPVITYTSSNNKITINWESQPPVTKFEVYRSTNNKTYKKIATVTTNNYVDKGLTYGKKYYYKVRAYDSSKWSSYSNIVSKKVKPNKVENLRTSIGTNNVKLSWDKVSVTGYEVYMNNKKVATITKSKTVTYNKKKLKANTKYTFKVKAYKKVGSKKVYGPWSDNITVTTAPQAPKLSLSIKEYNEMNLKIGNVKGATDYKVEKSLNGKTYTSLENLPGPGTLAVSGHEIGKTYYYRVKTCNSNGTCSKWTVVSKKQTTRVPDFSLETTSKNVMITITAVQEADGYEIYRSTSKNGKYTLVKSLTDLTYNNKTKKGTKYYYKVRSYKTVSGKKVYSSYTKVQNIKSK